MIGKKQYKDFEHRVLENGIIPNLKTKKVLSCYVEGVVVRGK